MNLTCQYTFYVSWKITTSFVSKTNVLYSIQCRKKQVWAAQTNKPQRTFAPLGKCYLQLATVACQIFWRAILMYHEKYYIKSSIQFKKLDHGVQSFKCHLSLDFFFKASFRICVLCPSNAGSNLWCNVCPKYSYRRQFQTMRPTLQPALNPSVCD